MRAIKKLKNLTFAIHEAVWWVVSELEDWLYPYKDRLTPEESFQIRVKDFDTGENYMVEELIQSQNDRIERLQDEMINVQNRLDDHEQKLKTKIRIKKDSTSVSGDIKNIFNS